MSDNAFRPAAGLEADMHALMSEMPETRPGKMFGCPVYKVNGKLALGFHPQQGVFLKLGQARASALLAAGSVQPFEPMPGRAWKDWVLLTEDLEAARPLLAEAVAFVRRAAGA